MEKCNRGYSSAVSDSIKIEKYIDPITGFLHVKGVIARSGIQEYYGMQLPFEGLEPTKKYAVLREPSEVSDNDSIASFRNAPVTDEHPSSLVTVDNYKNFQKGSVSIIYVLNEDETLLQTDITIYDSSLIEKVNNGTVTMSAGYTCDYEEEAGEYKGVPYLFKQKNIRGNHVAMTDSPRCGDVCKMTIDSNTTITNDNSIQGSIMATVVINGAEFEVPEEVAAYIETLKTEEVAEGKETPAIDEDMEKLKAENDLLKERAVSDSDAITKMVVERAEMIGTAKSIGITVSVNDSVIDIKRQIIKAKRNIETSDKSEAYVCAAFDMIMDDMAAASASHDKVANEVKDSTKQSVWESIKDKEF